jgi:hypothetical protein
MKYKTKYSEVIDLLENETGLVGNDMGTLGNDYYFHAPKIRMILNQNNHFQHHRKKLQLYRTLECMIRHRIERTIGYMNKSQAKNTDKNETKQIRERKSI